MSNPITPNWHDLIDKTDDELREVLSELNNQSLRKLTRETIKSIVEHRDHIQFQKEAKGKLYDQLNQIAELAERRE